MKRSTHEEVLNGLEERLREGGRYERIRRHVDYSIRGIEGELDIEGTRLSGRKVYFEVKSKHNEGAWKRAVEQFDRLEAAQPGKYWFVYYTPQRVIMYRPRQ